LDAASGRVTWVKSEKKNSLLFIEMLNQLVEAYPKAKVIHVVLDNFKIHDSKASRAAVEALAGTVALHFLPPYCPNENKIERMWLDVHANVTRNHRCANINELMRRVVNYLAGRNRRQAATPRRAA
jgi:transposase